jgi:hypothetical protein
MSDLYLIAHKVRGEPAYDVAVRMEMPNGPWWIIPTSGHRAYPYNWALYDFEQLLPPCTGMPVDLPDHYPLADYTNRATEPPRSGRPAIPNLEDI